MSKNITALSGQNEELKAAVMRVVSELAKEEAAVWNLRRAEIRLWQEHGASVPPSETDALVDQCDALLSARLPLMLAEIDALHAADTERGSLRIAADKAAAEVARRQADFALMEDDIRKRITSGPEVSALSERERKLAAMAERSQGWREALEPLVSDRLAAYDGDKIFSYLRDRAFGTEAYKARWPMSRFDAVVANWAGYASSAAEREKVASYVEEYASKVDGVHRSLADIEPRRRSTIASIKAELEPVREALAHALISTSDVVDRFASSTARKAQAIAKLRSFAAGKDRGYEMAAEAVIMATARVRAAAALRSEDAKALGPNSKISKSLEDNVARRLASARRADAVRRNLLGLLDRLEDVQKALDKAVSGEMDPREIEFMLASNEVELA